MRRPNSSIVGLVLIAVGVLLVLGRLPIFGALPSFLKLVLLFALGAYLWAWSKGRMPLAGRIALFAVVGVFAIPNAGRMAGVAALGYPAMAFALIYAADRRRWWPLLPAGVLGSLALVALSQELFPHWNPAPILFLGFAATFTLIYLLPTERGGQRWAIFPALLWILLTVVANDPGGTGSRLLLPAVLIGTGVFLLAWWRGDRPSREDRRQRRRERKRLRKARKRERRARRRDQS